MLTIELSAAKVEVGQLGPRKVLRFIDPQSGIVVSIPLDDEPARKIGAALLGGVMIAPAEALPDDGSRRR